jgi:hypothetical protein
MGLFSLSFELEKLSKQFFLHKIKDRLNRVHLLPCCYLRRGWMGAQLATSRQAGKAGERTVRAPRGGVNR